MIIGMSSLNAIIIQLQSSSFYFHFTGSRFFGYNSEESDYDFFVEDSPEVRNWLRNIGFIVSNDRIGYTETTFRRDNVDIQLTTEVNKKRRINNLLYRLNRFNFIDLSSMTKIDRKSLWDHLWSEL